jgi:hypothetical protein
MGNITIEILILLSKNEMKSWVVVETIRYRNGQAWFFLEIETETFIFSR